MNDNTTPIEATSISQKIQDELVNLFLGLSFVLQNQTKKVTEDETFRASLYFQPLNSTYSWMDDAIRCTQCHSCTLATAVLKLLVKKSGEIPDKNNYFLKTLSLETSRCLVNSSFKELEQILEPVLKDLSKFYEPVKGGRAPDGLGIKPVYKFRAQSCLGNKERWFRGVARIIYRYHLGRINRDVRDGFALVQVWR